MNATLIGKSKWFWPWEDDREEAWLGEMSRRGLHLVYPGAFIRYNFKQGGPREYAYRLDFVTQANKKPDYYQLFRDAGWEQIGERSGWQYWRKEARQGESPEIFTDVESKVQKYKRLFGFLAILFLPLFLSIFNMRTVMTNSSLTGHWIDQVFAGIYVLILATFLLYIYVFIRLGLRIQQLKRR